MNLAISTSSMTCTSPSPPHQRHSHRCLHLINDMHLAISTSPTAFTSPSPPHQQHAPRHLHLTNGIHIAISISSTTCTSPPPPHQRHAHRHLHLINDMHVAISTEWNISVSEVWLLTDRICHELLTELGKGDDSSLPCAGTGHTFTTY